MPVVKASAPIESASITQKQRLLPVQDQIDLVMVPSFTEVEIEGNERTAVRLSIFKRPVPAEVFASA